MKTERFLLARLVALSSVARCFSSITCYTKKTMKGHPVVCLGLGLTLALAVSATILVAQRAAAQTAPGQLTAAIALYQQGEVSLAQALFAAISANDPAYGVAQAYDAFCRYALCRAAATNDYRWFLTALASPAVQKAVLPQELWEDLAFKEIDALYQSGEFLTHNALPITKITTFQKEYPASARLGALAEYQLAAWFERGMRWVYKASFDDEASFQKHWADGLAHLNQFLTLAGNFAANDYAVLRDRSLAEDLQVARAVLGEKPATLADIPIRDVESQERYGFVRVGLYQKLHPTEWDRNLQMLADFQKELQTLPPSGNWARVERDLAHFGFQTGEQLLRGAVAALPGETQTTGDNRAAARRYFAIARALQRDVRVDLPARITAADVAWLRVALYDSYYFEQDYGGLLSVAAAQLTNSTPGDLEWLLAKLYTGIALSYQTPPQPGAVAAVLEEVLAYGLQNERDHDWAVIAAARWRIGMAMKAGDYGKASALIEWVKQGNGEPKLKAEFHHAYAPMAGWLSQRLGR
jgi:hypothetical protein